MVLIVITSQSVFIKNVLTYVFCYQIQVVTSDLNMG